MVKKQESQPKSEEFTRFEGTLRKLIAVPKSEVDKERDKYERERGRGEKTKRPARKG